MRCHSGERAAACTVHVDGAVGDALGLLNDAEQKLLLRVMLLASWALVRRVVGLRLAAIDLLPTMEAATSRAACIEAAGVVVECVGHRIGGIGISGQAGDANGVGEDPLLQSARS